MSKKSGALIDMQFITSSISTMLVLLLLGTVVFFVLAANNLSVYVRENIAFSVLISDDMKDPDITVPEQAEHQALRKANRLYFKETGIAGAIGSYGNRPS